MAVYNKCDEDNHTPALKACVYKQTNKYVVGERSRLKYDTRELYLRSQGHNCYDKITRHSKKHHKECFIIIAFYLFILRL